MYLGAIAFGILGVLYSQGWISTELAGTIGAIISTWTGIALRAAWKKGGK